MRWVCHAVSLGTALYRMMPQGFLFTRVGLVLGLPCRRHRVMAVLLVLAGQPIVRIGCARRHSIPLSVTSFLPYTYAL
jgi:hypothetical protein